MKGRDSLRVAKEGKVRERYIVGKDLSGWEELGWERTLHLENID